MTKPSHNLMAYNSQICVDDKFKFIVATDVTSSGSDKQELHKMALQTKEVIDNPELIITADKGYYSAVEIKKCIDDGINTIVPPVRTGQELKLLDTYNAKMQTDESKVIIKKRSSVVEHLFGTIKRSLDWDYFLVRSKKKVAGENALIMFTYNFKRLLNLIGIALFRKLMIAIKDGDLSDIREEIALHIAKFRLYMAKIISNVFMLQFRQNICL